MTISEMKSIEDFEAAIEFHCRGKNFVVDGALNADLYKKQDVKILFLYLETYGYESNRKTLMSKEFPDWIKSSGTKTFKQCALLTKRIFDNIEILKTGKEIAPIHVNYFRELYPKNSLLINELSKVAFVNIRKTSNANVSADNKAILKESKENKELLVRQIDLLNPDIVITGGGLASNIFFNELCSDKGISYKLHYPLVIKNKVVAPLKHLSRPDYKYLYNRAKLIAELTRSNM